MKIGLRTVSYLIFSLCSFFGTAQKHPLFEKMEPRISDPNGKLAAYSFNQDMLTKALNGFSNSRAITDENGGIFFFPDASGGFERFEIMESSVMPLDMQKKYPLVKSYAGYGVDSPSKYLRFSLSPNKGLCGVILGGDRPVFYEPHPLSQNSFYVSEAASIWKTPFICQTVAHSQDLSPAQQRHSRAKNTSEKRIFTIALSTTGEYANFHGNTLAGVNAALVASLTNVSAVFERDFNISLVLAANNDDVVYLDMATDPYSGSPGDFGDELQNVLDSIIGDANYNLGHLLAASGGVGNANCIGCVCESGKKGSAYSSSNTPEGPHFDFSLLAHEIGHQFGANHTWTHGGNEGTNVQVEPGSGSTIMGYSGIAQSANILLANDSYFHGISIPQIENALSTMTCGSSGPCSNNRPKVNAGSDLTLPVGTPFKLIGTANDQESTLTYCWEQIDENDARTVFPKPNLNSSNAVLFRSFPPTTDHVRYFPNLHDLRFGLNQSQWEKVPVIPRSADFRLTVRDNNPQGGATSFDDMKVTFDKLYGPFEIVNFAEKDITLIQGSSQTIRWSVNNTNKLPGGESLNLRLSTDGGQSYGLVIAENIPNKGSFTFIVPDTVAANCRLMLEAKNFFSINKSNISIGVEVIESCSRYESEKSLGLTIPIFFDSNPLKHTISIPISNVISDIKVGVNISHPYIGNLDIALTSPAGTKIMLKTTQSCSNEENLVIIFDDDAIDFNCSESQLNAQPLKDSLSLVHGEDAEGDWTLEITNVDYELQGMLNSWFIELCETEEKAAFVNDHIFKDLIVYPNPNQGSFKVKAQALHSIKSLDLQLFNSTGQMVYSRHIPETTFLDEQVSIVGLDPGLYILRLKETGRSYVERILIK